MKALDIEKCVCPSQLSGGQQQRVALARMLAVNPMSFFWTNRCSNPMYIAPEMRAELERIHAEFGTTIVFVTHDQWEAMTLATQIAVMNEGTLQQIGTPNDILRPPRQPLRRRIRAAPPINIAAIPPVPAPWTAALPAG